MPLRNGIFLATPATALLSGIPLPFPYHNGSIFHDSLPLRSYIFLATPATVLLSGIPLPSPYHNGSKSSGSVPLRNGSFIATPTTPLLSGIPSSFPYHNGSISYDSLPLRSYIFLATPATVLLSGIPLPSPYHNGSISHDSLPLRNYIFLATPATVLLSGIPLPSPYHNGSISHDSLPLRQAPPLSLFLVRQGKTPAHLRLCGIEILHKPFRRLFLLILSQMPVTFPPIPIYDIRVNYPAQFHIRDSLLPIPVLALPLECLNFLPGHPRLYRPQRNRLIICTILLLLLFPFLIVAPVKIILKCIVCTEYRFNCLVLHK